MSFPSSFGSQVAAIMDVLAKAAVAEITKLVEDGAVALRLEMCRRDGEILELRRSLSLVEAELCKAQGAAATTDDKREQTTAPNQNQNQVSTKGEEGAQQPCAVYPEGRTVPSLCEPRGEMVEDDSVKHEPEDGLSVQDTDIDDRIWPLPACGMFDKSSVPVEQDIQTFLSGAEQQFPAHGNSERSYDASAATLGAAGNSLSVRIKVEQVVRPVCVASAAPGPGHAEHFELASRPSVSRDHGSDCALQQSGRSLVLPHQQSSAVTAGGHVLGRHGLRAKRPANVWRTSQKLFMCPECNRGFPRSSQLEEHKTTHQTFKPFRCLQCGKSFTQKTRLKTHQSVHTGERPFSCKICGKMFSRQDNCLRHERFHSGVRPYSCGQCGKSFTVLGNLRIHQEIHLQGR